VPAAVRRAQGGCVTDVGIAVGFAGAPFEQSLELAAAAEAAGLDLVAVGDASADNFTLLGAIAARTSRIGLVSSIATWTRTPVTTALASKTVSNLSDGRYRLGLGPMPRAWAEDWHGIDYSHPVERMRDYVATLRAAWRADPSAPIDHAGPFYSIRAFPGHPGACSHEIEVHLAATRPRMASLAGEIADGVIFNAVHSLDWVTEVGRPALERGLQRTGRAREAVTIGILRICAVSDDRAEAYDLARRSLSFYFGVPYFEEMLRHHGFLAELEAGLDAKARGDEAARVAAVSDALVDAMCVAGTPQEVRAALARHDGLVDWIELAGSVGHPPAVARAQLERIIATVARAPAPAGLRS
jgi:alkanesulfonate monooxygenase SsuD/methylene tetrahydromethanopterin reductase-like flavin-dependent oxidoreductase (luciferase family)